MKLTYLGHSCFIVESGGKKVVIDPYLRNNPLAAVKPEEVEVDAVLLTHGHYDHVADAEEIARRNDCVIVGIHEIAAYFAGVGLKTFGLNLGGKHTFDWGTVKLTLAFHSSGLELEGGKFLHGGQPAGILLTMDGQTLYHAGDTCLFGDMKLIGELHRIDAAALPIGDVFTMGPDEAAIAAEWLKAKTYIPIHHSTFPPIVQDAEAWVKQLKEKGLSGTALRPGESVSI
ncbi:hypothetical protein PAE9249_00626 [Paenibacillus sp. CECT 9249]|uniref:metal-dependent hydrolase n=1 Tax=Paenibacillus sp. CECT 9249 TaxID=2845385 RepID=UPI001E4AEA1D|nr:metal-dependent hydrolase [Paenibacillus sp. CECT 9249]CAH0118160.1 hypothetical protein PAE9249_00626 [Paenibacillus sp. CECT 9249]